ncbi:MAG: ABC transporter ATP-binding protein [Bacillota bacterium]
MQGRSDSGPGRTITVLQVEGLSVEYATSSGPLRAVEGASFRLHAGETLVIVGESGCGKTTLALGILRLLPRSASVTGGSVRFFFDGRAVEVTRLADHDLREVRWRVAAVVFQSALNAFNPLLRIRDHFLETAAAHGMRYRRGVLGKARKLLEMVQLEADRVLQAYPHELSGGMRQRALLALALLLDPKVLILDEPATALDILTQRSIIALLRSLKERLGLTLLLISHDLSLAAELADRVVTMYAGRIVEVGPVDEVFYRPSHPYTLALLESVPRLRGELHELRVLPGAPPSLVAPPAGCAFAARCPIARDICFRSVPELRALSGGRMSACHFAESQLEAVAAGEREPLAGER